jgi:omega-6 fatty acid desaturase (delta-12 desaturase)
MSTYPTLTPYAEPRLGRSLVEVATSVLPYLALMVVIYLTLGISFWLTLALALPAAGFLVRTFIVFHDCTHGSFLRGRRANAYLGALVGLLVLMPFRRWQHDHAVHHATSGDLDRRGVGDVLTLTVAEYRARPWRGRLAYRLLRNPLVMFGLGPVFAMIIGPRLVARSARPRMRHSVLATDAALAVIVSGLCWLIGWQQFLLVWAPAALLAGSVGIWLFYVQHQFEDAYWQGADDWVYGDAALRGSSYLRLPKVLQFFTGNIGLHHVHHLNARIPNYNLQSAHDDNPVFYGVPTLSVWDGMRSVRLKLWDERSAKLVTFRQARVPREAPNVVIPRPGVVLASREERRAIVEPLALRTVETEDRPRASGRLAQLGRVVGPGRPANRFQPNNAGWHSATRVRPFTGRDQLRPRIPAGAIWASTWLVGLVAIASAVGIVWLVVDALQLTMR